MLDRVRGKGSSKESKGQASKGIPEAINWIGSEISELVDSQVHPIPPLTGQPSEPPSVETSDQPARNRTAKQDQGLTSEEPRVIGPKPVSK